MPLELLMNSTSTTSVLIVILSSVSLAQVTIQNPQHLEISAQRVQMLHNIICHVVAKEFHTRDSKVAGPVTLVLGEREERTVADEPNGISTFYLQRWDEATFAISDMRLAVLRMVSHDHWQPMAREVIRRVNEVAPVNANAVHETNAAAAALKSDDK
jgi:hypothetical protein